jgi:hypothetical protein
MSAHAASPRGRLHAMNRRSVAAHSGQLALPGLAPLCPHCGGRRTSLVAAGDSGGGAADAVVSGQRWECRGCGRSFWSLPTMGGGSAGR